MDLLLFFKLFEIKNFSCNLHRVEGVEGRIGKKHEQKNVEAVEKK